MQTIFVTGASGYLGSHTCLLLLKMGFDVYALDSYINSFDNTLKKVNDIVKNECLNNKKGNLHIIKGDIRDEDTLREIFRKTKDNGSQIDCVIHFAGLKSIAESISNPLSYWDNNVNGSINLLKIMNESNCRTIVFSSSASIYGPIKKNKINENSVISPNSVYGRTKYVIEEILHDISESSKGKWRIANLRYFNPIGAHESGQIGDNPKGVPNNIFPLILKVASGQISKFEIYGNDWPTSDGTGVRDYIHVMDLAEGHICALQYLFGEKAQIVNFNLGTGLGTSVLELINIFQKVNNIEIPYIFKNRRSGDVASLVADPSFAKTRLNWIPKRSLENMCRDGWKWQLKNKLIQN